MCSKCHDRKVSFFDYIENKNKLHKDIEDDLYVCSQCKKVYKFNYRITTKKRTNLYNAILLPALIIFYFFIRKYIRFIELILLQFDIHLNGFLTILVRLIEFLFWVCSVNTVNIFIVIFFEWKLAKPNIVECQDAVQIDLNKDNLE